MKSLKHFRAVDIVTAVLAILFVIALSISLIRNRPSSNHPKVRAAIKAVIAAIKNYEGVYGALPCKDNSLERFGDANPEEYDKLMELLTGIEGPDKDNEVTKNSRQINFLYTFENYKTEGWVDEWKSRFNILLNSRNKQDVKIGSKTMLGSIFVYSSGPNRKDENGEGDDVAPWK